MADRQAQLYDRVGPAATDLLRLVDEVCAERGLPPGHSALNALRATGLSPADAFELLQTTNPNHWYEIANDLRAIAGRIHTTGKALNSAAGAVDWSGADHSAFLSTWSAELSALADPDDSTEARIRRTADWYDEVAVWLEGLRDEVLHATVAALASRPALVVKLGEPSGELAVAAAEITATVLTPVARALSKAPVAPHDLLTTQTGVATPTGLTTPAKQLRVQL